MAIALAGVVVGAILTFIFQAVARRAAMRSEVLRDRLDEFRQDIRALADAAGRYWMTDPTDVGLPRVEAQVFGLNHRLNAAAGLIGDLKTKFRTTIEDGLIEFSLWATGGQFQVNGRPAEPKRFIRIEHAATDLTRATRRFQRQLLRGWLW